MKKKRFGVNVRETALQPREKQKELQQEITLPVKSSLSHQIKIAHIVYVKYPALV